MSNGKILFAMRNDRDNTEPMGIMLLSALAKRQGYDTDLVLFERENIVDAVRRTNADVVAFSVITGSQQPTLLANAELKRAIPSVKTMIGGPHATYHPQMIREHDFDVVGVGECDEAWPELLERMAAGRPFDDIANIVTKENASRVLRRSLTDGVTISPEHLRDRTSNLDDLPFFDRVIINNNTRHGAKALRAIMAGRGCPFRCTYCFEHAHNEMMKGKGRILQRYSVRRVCEELKRLKRDWDTRYIKFYDDVFPVFRSDEAWLEEFADVYPREVGLPFHCLVRADLVNEESERKLRLLKKAGIASMTISIESGNGFARDFVLIRDMTDEDMRRAFASTRKLRIGTFANTILAMPIPTRPDIHAPQDAYDERLEHVLSVVREVGPRSGGNGAASGAKPAPLADAVAVLRQLPLPEERRRALIDRVLSEHGVRRHRIDYDKDSVRYNVAVGASFGEYPVFFPYPGTRLNAYAVRHGYFDGDHDKLHASYQTKLPLDCFTEHDKLQQQNLALLGTFLHLFGGSYNPAVRLLARPMTWLATEVLSHLPLTTAYFRLYSLSKTYMHETRVYPMPKSWREVWAIWRHNFKFDAFKQFKVKKAKKEKINPRPRTEATLGGPPPA